MNKRPVLLILFYLFTINASAQSFVDTPRIETNMLMNLAGKIDSITELTLAMRVMENGAGLQKTVISGDSTLTIPDTSLTLLEEHVLKFSKEDMLIEDETGRTNGKTTEIKDISATRYVYRKGKLAAKIHYTNTNMVDSTIFVHQHGRLWKADSYNNKKEYSGRILYGLNPDKKLLTISKKNAANALINMTRLKYNEDSDLVETALHDNTMKLVSTRTFIMEHDTDGRRHIMIFDFAKPDTATGMTSYLLDENGNHLEDVVQDENKRVTYYCTSRYDSLNNIIEQTIFTTEKLVVTYSYVYDALGNWVEKRIFHNNAPFQMTRRTIYYRPSAKL